MDATPILDRQEPLPPRERHNWRVMLIGGVAGALLVRWVPSIQPDFVLDHPLEFGLTLLAVYYLGVLVHELGHLAAGLGAGFAFRQFSVGPLVVYLEDGGLRLQFATARLLGGGQVMMVPESTERLRARFLRFIAGGPAATLLLFLIPLVWPMTWFTGSVLVLNTLLAFSSLLPYTINGRSTDAKLLLGLGKKGPAANRLATILYLLAIDSKGTAPRDWPADSLRALEGGGEDSPYREIGLMFVYFCAMDEGDPARIADALERVLATANKMNPDSRRAYFAEAAFVQGIFRKDAPLARAWLEDARKVKGTVPREDWDCAALAGIACAEGDTAQTCEHLTRAIAMLDRQPGTSGSVAACRERLAALRERKTD
uniref:Peptidase M50 domain-containing protein n=1 Tax=Solibacter usitatus (strain Ellin6076) TaxID=234267 RepID=Q026R5_SOLUE